MVVVNRRAKMLRSLIFVVAVCAGLWPYIKVSADDSQFREALADALQTAWGSKPEFVKAANEKFAVIDKLSPGDPRAIYGNVLVCMNQRRYDDALRLLDRLLTDEDERLEAWRAKIWIAMVRRNFGAALAACDRSITILSELEDVNSEVSNEHLRFIGRALGFMEGPAAEATGTASRPEIEERILGRLDETQIAELNQAKEEVLVRYSELISARDDSKAVAKAEAEETKTKLLQDVAEARVASEQRAEQLQASRDKLATEYNTEMDKIASQDAPLRSQIASLESQLATEQSSLAIVNSDISRLQIALARERDPVIRRRIQFDIDTLSVTASRMQANVFGIDRQIGAVNGQRATLAARQQSIQNRLGTQLNQIDKELTSLGKTVKKLDGTEKQINKAVQPIKGKVLSLNSKAASWTTYQPFPLIIERDRLLESLK